VAEKELALARREERADAALIQLVQKSGVINGATVVVVVIIIGWVRVGLVWIGVCGLGTAICRPFSKTVTRKRGDPTKMF
jgi:hypothetical protein